jgi:hypothetical protein
MLVINSIDKSRLSADSFSYSGNGVAWKARLVLFLGFALLAGGLAGSVTVLVLKYVVYNVGWPTLWFGVAGVCGSAGVMARFVSLLRNDLDEIANMETVHRFCGLHKTWRMSTRTTLLCNEIDIRNGSGLLVYDNFSLWI